MKLFPLIFAAVIAAGLIWRFRRLSTERRIIGVVLVVGFAVYGSGLVHPPNLEHTILRLGKTLGPYAYVLVGVMAFLETGAFVGLIAPGEFTILLGGVIAGQGRINVVVLIGVVWACAVAGDSVSYMLGRRLGRAFMVKHGPRVKITEERLVQVEGFFEHHGGKTILIGRFIGLVRAIAPFIAGSSRMPFRRFLPYDLIGAGLWGTTFVLLGYIFWQSFSQVVSIAKRGALALSLVITLVVAGVAAFRFLRVPDNRVRAQRWVDEQARRPALRPVAAVLRPLYSRVLAPAGRGLAGPARFAWERLTPGELGLELTTLLAVALVGGFVFGGGAALVADHQGFTGDGTAFDAARNLKTATLVDVAKLLTWAGSLPAMAAVVALTGVYLLARGRRTEAGAVVGGAVLTIVAVHVAKAATDRPRPSGSLVDTAGSSFPSGHAAYSIAFVAVAIALARALPGFLYRAAFVAVALVLAVVVGLSRVYLRAHYLSDVVAGWGLAAALFALCAMVALVVDFIRHNDSAPTPASS